MKKLGTILEEAGVIDEIQLVRALSHQRKWRCRLGRSLVELGFVTEERIAKAIATQLGMTYREFDPKQTPAELFDLIPKTTASEKLIFPVGYSGMAGGKTVLVAMADPTDKDSLRDLEQASGCRLEPVVGKDSAIEDALGGWERFKASNARSDPADIIAPPLSEVAPPPEPAVDMSIDYAGMESANVVEEQWPGDEEQIEEIDAAPIEDAYEPPSTETMPLTEEDIPDESIHVESLIPPDKPAEMEEILSVAGLPPIDEEEELPQEIPEIEHSEAWEQVMPDQMPQIDQSAGMEMEEDLPEISHAEPWESIMPGVDAAKQNDEPVEPPMEQPEEPPAEQEPASVESDNSPPPAPESFPAWPGMGESNTALPPEWEDSNSMTLPEAPPIIKPTPPPLPPIVKAELPPLPKITPPPLPVFKTEPPPLPKITPPPPPVVKAEPPPLPKITPPPPPIVKAELPPLPKITPPPPPIVKAEPPPIIKPAPPPLPVIEPAPPPPPVAKVEPLPVIPPEPLPVIEPSLPPPAQPKPEQAKSDATTTEYLVEEISDMKMQLTLLRKEIKILKEALSKVMRGT